ncbi:DUF441 domain-containing protein [Tuberibacillus sp. Marseille-P3662]|uniref:DUF441 domain-containing protein n=1 Tax=Tuberibacillus sp. Marseille-P3662 TaxID=1965358 RepID=UPI000A1CB888|nr:DUF441 domain-containing protein [Tuberibacillus sp. Marseille-P3662]
MFNGPILFLLLLLIIGFIAKNQSLMIAVGFLLVIKIIGLDDKIFPYFQSKGIKWGVTIITIAVLVPIATGEIGFKQMGDALRSYSAWIALGSGVIVSLIARNGLTLLADDPHITTALVMGTVLAVALLNGVPVGPLIGAGIAYLAIRLVQLMA